jgi:hypothetical protein
MTAGNLCDNCGKFAPSGDPRWWYLIRQPAEPVSPMAVVFGERQEPGTFCSLICVSEFAYVQAVTTGKPAGMEPPPKAGTGWPT